MRQRGTDRVCHISTGREQDLTGVPGGRFSMADLLVGIGIGIDRGYDTDGPRPARSTGLRESGVAYPNRPSRPRADTRERRAQRCQVARVRATSGIGRVVFVWYAS